MEAGDVAFLKHTTVKEMTESRSFKGVSTDQLQLLCKNGQRMPVEDYLQCNWGMVPSNAIVTSSARTPEERRKYVKFLQEANKLYSHKQSLNTTLNSNNNNDRFNRFQPDRFNQNPNDRRNNDRSFTRSPFEASSTESPLNETQPFESFEMFESNRYGARLNLMFQVSEFLYPDSSNCNRFVNRIQRSACVRLKKPNKHSNRSLVNTRKLFTTFVSVQSTACRCA